MAARRNYDSVFRGILDTPALWNNSNFRLSLIGKGQDVSVPDSLRDKVQMHRSLPYGVCFLACSSYHRAAAGKETQALRSYKCHLDQRFLVLHALESLRYASQFPPCCILYPIQV